MAKVYQAFYKNSNGVTSRHNGASLTKVEKEARLTAKELGVTVGVDVLEIEKPSLKLVIKMLNGGAPLSRTPVCFFQTTHPYVVTDDEGLPKRKWRVERIEA